MSDRDDSRDDCAERARQAQFVAIGSHSVITERDHFEQIGYSKGFDEGFEVAAELYGLFQHIDADNVDEAD